MRQDAAAVQISHHEGQLASWPHTNIYTHTRTHTSILWIKARGCQILFFSMTLRAWTRGKSTPMWREIWSRPDERIKCKLPRQPPFDDRLRGKLKIQEQRKVMKTLLCELYTILCFEKVAVDGRGTQKGHFIDWNVTMLKHTGRKRLRKRQLVFVA